MKRFRFRLERVLQHKAEVREERRRELALANAKLRDEEVQLSKYEAAAAQNRLDTGPVPIEQLHLRGLYGQRLVRLVAEAKELVEEARKGVEQAMRRYVEASQEAEALETLKKKKKAEYLEWVQKEEEKFLDELSTQRAGRPREGT